ncbi:MAG: 5-oxoprolinase subunit PxpB [Synergistes jonesii]|uniref:5-oxoprolinase subunit PxpB n=1 Tax=Synergistes jonesii TaxID=2754 RepID=UPI002A74C452|nr:5-oxoprolinase subunit PxpB [Synergistes jonesii]MDY2985715.1 5-oxoprolinase subunit PxpB [Synergistes jonesii]
MKILIAGDSALVVRFGNEISEEINQKVRAFRIAAQNSRIDGVVEYIPTYCTVYIIYDPLIISTNDLIKKLNTVAEEAAHIKLPEANIVKVPVVYGGENGPDLESLAKFHNLTPEEVVKRHTAKDYLVYMLGFTPGFSFCGAVDDDIATPRLKSPRLKVPAGSIGIAGKQTGLYAITSPGGWQLIGRSTMRFYDPEKEPPVPVKAGDYVRFVPISAEEFEKHRSEVEAADNPPDYSSWSPNGTAAFSVITPGALSSIQDRGRKGYQEFGISGSGAMDELALRLANKIVGNNDNAPALEVTMLGPKLEAEKELLVAVTGADLSLTINSKPAEMYRALKLEKGDTLAFGVPKSGMRAYVAVNGGFSIPLVMGSAATGLNGKIGGYMGRKLEKGDVLKSTSETIPTAFVGYSTDPKEFSFGAEPGVFRVILGPEDDYFSEAGKNTFFSSEYKLTDNCDRMGARLEGAQVEHNDKGAGIVSDGISMGAIQIPGDGNPLVLLKDRGTVGGYTKIGSLCTVDVFRFAQNRPGDKVRFKLISLEEAQGLLKQMEYKLSKVGLLQNMLERSGGAKGEAFKITIGNDSYDVFIEEIR